jgi:hypothetical protein
LSAQLWEEIWKEYSGKRKILLMMLSTLKWKIAQRAVMLAKNDKKELLEKEEYWQNFARRWKNTIEEAKEENWNWRKYLQKNGARMKEYWVVSGLIKGDYIQKDVGEIMKVQYRPEKPTANSNRTKIKKERTICLEVIMRYIDLLDREDGISSAFKVEELEKEDWHKLQNIRFEEKDPVELENHIESISLKGDGEREITAP